MGGSGYELWKVVEQGRLDNDECFIALIVDFLQYSLWNLIHDLNLN